MLRIGLNPGLHLAPEPLCLVGGIHVEVYTEGFGLGEDVADL
jgi:hypothetical protein